MRPAMCIPLGVLLAAGAGCEWVLSQLIANQTSVRLVNHSDFPVSVTLYTDEEQNIPEDLLTEVGTRMQYTLAPGQVEVFSDDCDSLQAIVIDDADLEVVGSIGPSDHSSVLRDGSDFGCGDTITFTFDHSALLVDFSVAVAIE